MPAVEDFEPIIQYLRNKLPQLGFFSTLDDAIRSAPFEKASPEQWKNYLKPGLTIQRKGAMFPLKKEELDYSGVPELLDTVKKGDPNVLENWRKLHGTDEKEISPKSISKRVVQEHAQRMRPAFRVDTRMTPDNTENSVSYAQSKKRLPELSVIDDPSLSLDVPTKKALQERAPYVHEASFGEYAHQPGIPGSYEESVTLSPDFGTFDSHFSPRDISWSRTTRHLTPEQKLFRLVEEIQSDRHEAAAEKVFKPTIEQRNERRTLLEKLGSGANPYDLIVNETPQTESDQIKARIQELEKQSTQRRGYRTPEDELLIDRANADDPSIENWSEIKQMQQEKPPDTPFKSPSDYALLELKKQLINAVHQGDQYLGLTRGSDQVGRWEQGMGGGKGEGMSYTYDQVYPSALKKLARMYGADVKDVTVPVSGEAKDTRPELFRENNVDTPSEYLDQLQYDADGDPTEISRGIHDLIDEYKAGLQNEDGTSPVLILADNLHKLADSPDDNTRRLVHGLNNLHRLWNLKMAQEGGNAAGQIQKTFPSLEITPEVAEKVKGAGVPLFAQGGDVMSPLQRYVEGSNNLGGNSSNDQYLKFLVRAGAMRMGLPPPDVIYDPIPGMAKGGSSGKSWSALKWLARTAQQPESAAIRSVDATGPKGRARFIVKAAEQLYGLDPSGHPVFMGWMNPTHWGQKGYIQHSTSPEIVSEALGIPDQIAQLAKLAQHYFPERWLGGDPRNLLINHDPSWSKESNQDIRRLNRAVAKQTGIGPAHTLAGMGEDLAGQILPIAGIAQLAPEGTLARHALNELAGWAGAGGSNTPASNAGHLSRADVENILEINSNVDPELVRGP